MDFFSACCVPGRDATMGSLINSNFRVRPSSKFAHTVDRVKEYHNYIGYLALSISRVLLIGGKYYKNTYRLRRSFKSATLHRHIATTDGSIKYITVSFLAFPTYVGVIFTSTCLSRCFRPTMGPRLDRLIAPVENIAWTHSPCKLSIETTRYHQQ